MIFSLQFTIPKEFWLAWVRSKKKLKTKNSIFLFLIFSTWCFEIIEIRIQMWLKICFLCPHCALCYDCTACPHETHHPKWKWCKNNKYRALCLVPSASNYYHHLLRMRKTYLLIFISDRSKHVKRPLVY